MSEPYPIALFGAAGRLGREIIAQAGRFERLRIVAAYDAKPPKETVAGVKIIKPPEVLPEGIRAILDFSSADAVLSHLDLALDARCAYVTGITGLPQDEVNELRAAANEIPVLHSPNMSVGMNLMFHLAALTAQTLPDYAKHVIEIHHTAKKDAPSGTAIKLADAVENVTGSTIEITSLRMGDVVGEHRLVFGGHGERLEIVHRADSRTVFAVGALRAVEWVLDHRYPGFYTMREVLGL